MYKILINVSERTNHMSLYRLYCTTDENGVNTPFETKDVDELESTLTELTKLYSRDKLKVIHDVEWDSLVSVTACESI